MKYYHLILTMVVFLCGKAVAEPYEFQNTKLKDDKRSRSWGTLAPQWRQDS